MAAAGAFLLANAGTIGAVVSAGSAIYGGIKQNQMAKFNAKVAENEATYQKQKAAVDLKNKQREVARLRGAQRTGMAASGVSLLSGSFQDIDLETLSEAERDYSAIRFGGDVNAARSINQAKLDKQQGVNALVSGGINAGSTLLTAYGKYKTPSLN